MARMTKAEIMEGIECDSSRVIGNNTVEYEIHHTDGTLAQRRIRHFRTDILTFVYMTNDVTVIKFNTDGHMSKTTKDRLNEYQDVLTIYQENRVWYCVPRGRPNFWQMTKDERRKYTVIFADGMWWASRANVAAENVVEFSGGFIVNAGTLPDPKLIKRIKAYVKKFVAALPVEAPGPGDCLMCCMDSGSCLDSHMEEDYFVPRLMYNALSQAGAGPAYMRAAFDKSQWFIRLDDDYTKQQYTKWLYNYMYKRLVNGQTGASVRSVTL